MSARATKSIAQKAPKASSKARHASIMSSTPSKKTPDLGRQIFVYNHLQTNQVVYSLTKAVNNNHALRQLPYNGKKTVPRALRKDLWTPLACITFHSSAAAATPSTSLSSYGLRTFQKLREYRKLHETLWPLEIAKDEEGKTLSRKLRGRKLVDQKANSVADMAAALRSVTVREAGKENLKEPGKEGPDVMATVLWADILDAEFAESWPETVVHDKWETTRNNRRPSTGKVGLDG